MNSRKILFVLLAATAMESAGGCASIFSGGSERVQFTSKPAGAEVVVVDANNNVVGKGDTPCEIELSRGAGYFRPAAYTARISAQGGPARNVPLRAGLNPMYLGNLVIGGALGMLIVDPLTGAMFSFPDTDVDFTTDPPPGSSNSQ
jgi:hypothetical protein